MVMIDWRKWFVASKRFWTLGVGVLIHILIQTKVIPADSADAMTDQLLTFLRWIETLLLGSGAVLAFRGGPALTFSKRRADVTTVANPPATVTTFPPTR